MRVVRRIKHDITCKSSAEMTRLLNILIRSRHWNTALYESVRFAGHSKWANIKHTKALEDAKRQITFARLGRAMEVAVNEGGSANPAENVQLQQVLDRAKVANMPAATVQRYLTRFAEKSNTGSAVTIEAKGSGGYTIIITYSSSNPKNLLEIRGKLKRYGAKELAVRSKGLFEHFHLIYARKDCTLDQAIEDAIIAGAEEVEEIDEDGNKYLQFRSTIEEAPKVASQLRSLNYIISSMERMHIPLVYVQLDEADSKLATELQKKLLDLDFIEKVSTNIGEDES